MPNIQTIIGSDFPKLVVPVIDAAEKSIEIIIFDWRWYPQDGSCPAQIFNQAIVRAARRGVEVRVIANNEDICQILRGLGCAAKRLVNKKLVHAKMMLVDKNICILGSHNYTQNAFTMNCELSVLMTSEATFSDFSKYFDNLWA